jgi:sigma-B regulation protein RsbQ
VSRHDVRERGRGPVPVLLAHGLGCDQSVWSRLVPRIEGDARVVSFDHVGFGAVAREHYDPSRYDSLESWARDLAELVDGLALRGAVLVAHSIASTFGILAALRDPGLFSHLVLLAPSPRFLDDAPDYVGGFQAKEIDELLTLMDQNFLGWAELFSGLVSRDRELRSELVDRFCISDPRALRGLAQLCFASDVRAALPLVEVPTTIVQCDADPIAPRSVGAFMQRAIRGSRLVEVEVVGHFPQVDQPEAVAAIVRSVLPR